jgi:N-acylneuraminate cytidylyltransferase
MPSLPIPSILAVVPARGGSKGLPGKNMRLLAGHPLLAYSVQAALLSPSVTRVICSTDDEALAAVALQYGAEVPFMRPAHLAQDMSTDLEVFVHLLAELKQTKGYVPDYVIQLRPTSPLRRVADIEACIARLLSEPEADSLRVVTESPLTPYKMWRLPSANDSPFLQPLLPAPVGYLEPYNEPRQRLPKTYWQIGTLDVIRTRTITELNSMSGSHILPFELEQALAVDIDDLASFEKAELLLKQYPDLVQFSKSN